MTKRADAVAHPLDEQSAIDGDVLGTYLHGLFENREVREAFISTVFERAGRTPPADRHERLSPHERAASLIEANVDLEWIDGLPAREA